MALAQVGKQKRACARAGFHRIADWLRAGGSRIRFKRTRRKSARGVQARSYFSDTTEIIVKRIAHQLRWRHRLTPATYFAHRVNAPALALEIGPHQHFAQQAGAEHHQAAQQQQAAQDHQRSVVAQQS